MKENRLAELSMEFSVDIEYMSSSSNMRGMIINPDTETHCFIGKEAF